MRSKAGGTLSANSNSSSMAATQISQRDQLGKELRRELTRGIEPNKIGENKMRVRSEGWKMEPESDQVLTP
jgi:hypothetical protein